MYHLVQEVNENDRNRNSEHPGKADKFFQTGQTLPVAYRIEQLQKLKDSITRHEPDLNLALKADLGKSETESYSVR